MTPQTQTIPVETQISIEAFGEIWRENQMGADHPATIAGLEAIDNHEPAIEAATIYMTDVTLRDGQQQRMNKITTGQRIEVFDNIVSTGVDRIEIGHLGNNGSSPELENHDELGGDQKFATELIRHIAEKEADDPRYADLKLQVLFGSQEDLIKEGSSVLQQAFKENYPDSWQEEMARRIVVHVYDRVDPHLIATASKPYNNQESARRVCVASDHALEAGFRHFSISGEAATAVDPESNAQFYRSIIEYLKYNGAETINVNLPNTYGYSATADWNPATMTAFNSAVKQGHGEEVTTSIHPHNDVDNAVSFTMDALAAGFDRVEGTIIGVGERSGNVATIDVLARILEHARHQKIREQRIQRMSRFSRYAAGLTMQRNVRIDESILENLEEWYGAAERIAEIFGPHAMYRWHRTAVGNPYAHDNGSGPHDQAMAAAIVDPLNYPADSNYEWALLINSTLGRPETEDIAIGEPESVKRVTVANHAAGGKSWAIKKDELPRAPREIVDQARQAFRHRKQSLKDIAGEGVIIISG